MNRYKPYDFRHFRRFGHAFCIASIPLFLASAIAQDADDEDIFELSPFTVDATDQSGYRATSTLAGSRLKTDLKDVGSAISVVTQEFMDDTGATDAGTLLSYTVSTEVSGVNGNYTGAAAGGQEDSNTATRADPQGSTRVRGLSRAAATRDYFLTAFGFDSYNTESVTISRGPNSILFGIGEPGGIIENSIKKARFGSDITRLQFRFGENGSHRTSLDVNRELIDNRLAVRFNVLNERTEFQQEPAYEKDRRFTVSAKANLLTNKNREWMGPTTLNANYEVGEIRGTPPSVTPPQNAMITWWEPPTTPEGDAMVGVTKWDAEYRADYASQWVIDRIGDTTTEGNKLNAAPGIWSAFAIVYGDRSGQPGVGGGNTTQVIDGASGGFELTLPDGETITTPGNFLLNGTHHRPFNGHTGWGNFYPSFQDTSIYDWKNNLLPGRAQYVNHDFDVVNLTLEQSFFNNTLGFQLAYDKQGYDREQHFPMGNNFYTSVRIDTGLYLTDGTPNPNVGRPFVGGFIDGTKSFADERETMRGTAYYKLDFTEKDGWAKWLGDHTVNGLWNTYKADNTSRNMKWNWDDSADPSIDLRNNISKPGGWGAQMFFFSYVGDPQFDAESWQDVKLYDDYLRLDLPEVGEEFSVSYWDKNTGTIQSSDKLRANQYLGALSAKHQNIDSQAFTLQSKFFNDNIIATYGWREDTTKTYEVDQGPFQDTDTLYYSEDAYTQGWRNADGVGTLAQADPTLEETGDTATTQLVAHIPDEWMNWGGDFLSGISFHYAESENFNPASVRRDVWGNVLSSPYGETKEHGVALNMLNGKAHVRATWYETTSANQNNPNFTRVSSIIWPISQAQRWLNSKNASYSGGLQFEDYAYWSDSEGSAGPDVINAEYMPERLGGFNNFDEVISAFLAVMPEGHGFELERTGAPGDETITRTNPSGLNTVADSISEGFEIEMVYNITRNWRVAFNASKTESIFGNGLKSAGPMIEQILANYSALGLDQGITDTPNENSDPVERFNNNVTTYYLGALAKEGTVSSELRKWRWNMVTNYDFKEGALKGFGLGGSLRWQDEVSTGYPFIRGEGDILIPDLANPWTGGDRMDGDVWFSYNTKIKERKVKFQLNLQNALSDSEDIIASHFPDGTIRTIRRGPEKRWFLTTTIDF